MLDLLYFLLFGLVVGLILVYSERENLTLQEVETKVEATQKNVDALEQNVTKLNKTFADQQDKMKAASDQAALAKASISSAHA
jgi:chaperonin cofactor prefoldin